MTLRSRATLDQLITQLRQTLRAAIEIGGHTDKFGAQDYNVELSRRHAEAVRHYFISHGLTNQFTVRSLWRLTTVVGGTDAGRPPAQPSHRIARERSCATYDQSSSARSWGASSSQLAIGGASRMAAATPIRPANARSSSGTSPPPCGRKEQRLEKAQYELKAQTAEMQTSREQDHRIRGVQPIHPAGTPYTKRSPPGASRGVGRPHAATDGPGGGRSLCSPACGRVCRGGRRSTVGRSPTTPSHQPGGSTDARVE